jgi:hypothetical protein
VQATALSRTPGFGKAFSRPPLGLAVHLAKMQVPAQVHSRGSVVRVGVGVVVGVVIDVVIDVDVDVDAGVGVGGDDNVDVGVGGWMLMMVTPLALGSAHPGRDQRPEGQVRVPSLRPAQRIPTCVEGTVGGRPRVVVAGRVRAGRRIAADVHPVDADVAAHLGPGRLNYRGAAHRLVVRRSMAVQAAGMARSLSCRSAVSLSVTAVW